MAKYRIAHFSDFHLRDQGIELERATNLLRDAIKQKVDHIVITGDIVDAAQTNIVGSLWARLRRSGWSSGTKLTFCPGNHDIFPVSKRFPFFAVSRPTERFRELCRLTRSSWQGPGVEALGAPYPVGKVLCDSVVLAALDTTRNRQYLPTRWAEGEISEEDQESVKSFFEEHLDKPHRIIAMHHTPFEIQSESSLASMNFKSPPPASVQEWLQACRATLVLCGHVHCETVRGKLFRGCWVLQSGTAGACDEEDPPDEAVRTYHIVELSERGKVGFVARSFRGEELDAR